MHKKSWFFILVALIMAASMMLTACKPEAAATQNTGAVEEEQVSEEAAPAAEEEEAEAAPAAEEAVVEEEAPTSAGDLVWALSAEPDTLDCQKTASGFSDLICGYISAALVTKDPETDETIPWLAESWEVSEDGLTYTFNIKEGVKFHDGSDMTAEDLAFTFNRALDPETASSGTIGMLEGVESTEAADAQTLVFHMASPNALLLENLISAGYMMVFSQDYVEANDADYLSRNPMSVGPFIFQEWVTGDHITLTRNPDYNWGPAFAEGAYNINSIIFRIIPDESTIISGLEAGEIDVFETSTPSVIDQLKDLDSIYMEQGLNFGVYGILLNTSLPAFNQLEIRQAFNYAVDREAIINVVLRGYGIPAYGPFSPAVYGYDETLAETGYGYDPDKAKELLESVGYTLNDNGFYEKDGEELAMVLNTMDQTDTSKKLAEILQQQYKESGINVEIQVVELGTAIQGLMTGEFEMSIMSFGMPNASILNMIFSKNSIGGAVFAGLDTNDLEDLLTSVLTINNSDAWLENVHAAQQNIISNALFVPIFHETEYMIANTDYQGIEYTTATEVVLNNAYYVGE